MSRTDHHGATIYRGDGGERVNGVLYAVARKHHHQPCARQAIASELALMGSDAPRTVGHEVIRLGKQPRYSYVGLVVEPVYTIQSRNYAPRPIEATTRKERTMSTPTPKVQHLSLNMTYGERAYYLRLIRIQRFTPKAAEQAVMNRRRDEADIHQVRDCWNEQTSKRTARSLCY